MAKLSDQSPDQSPASATEAQEIISRYDRLKSERSNFDILWDSAARYILQTRGNILTKLSPGQPQMDEIYDTTATEAAETGAAGFVTHIMPAGEKWFRLSPKRRKGGATASSEESAWLDALCDETMEALIGSNFYREIQTDARDGMVFGTSNIFIEERDGEPSFTNFPVGSYVIEENDKGQVDTVLREWRWTARQAALRWGEEVLGKQLRAALKSPTGSSKKFTFIQLIEPRQGVNYKGGLVSQELRPVRCVYVSREDMKVLAEDGYYEMPALVSRLEKSNDEDYGRGPGVQALPEIRLINTMKLDLITSVELQIKPPWLVPNEADIDGVENVPDGLTFYSGGKENAPSQLTPKNQVGIADAKTLLDEMREHVRRMFWNDMFKLLTNQQEMSREKTAYEVQQMIAEKLVLFSPIFSRYVSERLNPLIERVVAIVIRSGRMPPPPPGIIENGGYEITYTSKIALALKSAENQSIATITALLGQLAQFDANCLDIVNLPEAVRRVAHNIGLPAALIRSEAEAAEIAAARAQQQQAMQAAQLAEQGAGAVQKMGPDAQKAATEAMMKMGGRAK